VWVDRLVPAQPSAAPVSKRFDTGIPVLPGTVQQKEPSPAVLISRGRGDTGRRMIQLAGRSER
jgi:hypothetical protein